MTYFEKNLQALRHAQPRCAAQVEQIAPPTDFEPMAGTDGTCTFARVTKVPNGQTRLEWLGHTSMPAASAEAIVANLDAKAGGANGLGLSIGSGFEWAAFATRLGQTQAIFVYEPQPTLRLALEICDLSPLLASRKLILLTGTAQDAATALAALLRENIGIEPPTVLHPLPTLGGGHIEIKNQMLAAGELIVRHAVADRQAQADAILSHLNRTASLSHPGDPHTIAFTLTPKYRDERPLHIELNLLNARPIPVDAHDSASLPYRMKIMAEALELSAVRVMSDRYRVQLACIPAHTPVETWVPPNAGPHYWEELPNPGTLAHADRIVVHSIYHQDRLISKGIPPESIIKRPHSLHINEPLRTPPTASPHRVAVIGDLPKTSLEALDIVLPTHQAIYNAARQLIAEDYLSLHPGNIADLVRRALARAGVEGKADAALRETTSNLIRDVLLPAIPLLTLAHTLSNAGIPVALVGNWPEIEPTTSGHNDTIVRSFNDPHLWQDVALLIHHAPTGVVLPAAWDAIVHGVPIIAVNHPTDHNFGALTKVLTPEIDFAQTRPSNLVTAVKTLLRSPDHCRKFATAAKEKIKLLAAKGPE